MIKPHNYLFVLLLLGLFAFHGISADESHILEITTQGFGASQPQEGSVGEFPRLRVRIESSERIKKLTIKERSYEVDLAKTKDKYNLQLFGLNIPPRSSPDVTLNLQEYINEKVKRAGEYEIRILVTDKKDNTVEKSVFINTHETMVETKSGIDDNVLLQAESFKLQRTGAERVKGSHLFGIDWKTIEKSNVTIKITKSENSDARLVMLDKSDFDAIQTVDHLVEIFTGNEDIEAVVLPTVNNKSAGKVLAICYHEKYYLLKIMKSSTSTSEAGTIVTVEGDYKYQGYDK